MHETITEEQRELASLFSLGMLDADESRDFEAHLGGCPSAREVQDLRAMFVAVSATIAEDVAEALPADVPPPHLKERLMRRIAAEAVPSPVIQRAHEGVWETILPGVDVKRLFIDPITSSVTSLVRVARNAVYPAHRHMGMEHLYVLDGDIIFEDHTLTDGDYEVRMPDSNHSPARTTEGCLLLVINSGHDQFLP
jgi:anti-sigma factor ChrR (cupin superfamily)